MFKDSSAYRSVGYIHVRDGKARTYREGEVGEVELVRTLVAGKGKPSGRFSGSIVQVSVVQRIGGVKYPPRRDNSQSSYKSQRYASYRFQVAYIRHQADGQHQSHQAYEDDEIQRARPTDQEQCPQDSQNR